MSERIERNRAVRAENKALYIRWIFMLPEPSEQVEQMAGEFIAPWRRMCIHWFTMKIYLIDQKYLSPKITQNRGEIIISTSRLQKFQSSRRCL